MRLQLQLPQLEYSLNHPHPRNNLFLALTVLLFVLLLPILVIVNLVTLGYELVPSLQSNFKYNNTLAGWWGSSRLPQLLGGRTPPCEPQDLGRGDAFRLTASLFDYTVMSTWNTTRATTSSSELQKQERFEYRGESFAHCRVNTAQFDYSLLDGTQTITVGVRCNGTAAYPVEVSMETKLVFAWLLSKDFIGQYYGPGLDLLNIEDVDPHDYRKLAFAVLEAISTDSLTIMRGEHLSSPVLSINAYAAIDFIDGVIDNTPISNSVTYLNGTKDSWPPEAEIYAVSIINLMNIATHTVNLDLGSAGPESIYRNVSTVNKTIGENLAPDGIPRAEWARNSQSFYYGSVTPPFETWAQMLRAGKTITLGSVTGLPNESSMFTSYLCPTYKLKPIRSLLASIFVGTATMCMLIWAAWMLVTAFIAKRISEPCMDCPCSRCQEKWLRIQNALGAITPGPNSPNGRVSREPPLLETEEFRPKFVSGTSYMTYSTVAERGR